jgi:transposase-like protein
MIRRHYTDDERSDALAALAANGGNVEKTAEQVGVPAATLGHWAAGRRHPEALHMAGEKKEALADRLEALANQLVDDMGLPAKRKAANLRQLAVAFGVCIDKMRLLREQPTLIPGPWPDPRKMTDEQLAAEIARLQGEVAGAGAGR